MVLMKMSVIVFSVGWGLWECRVIGLIIWLYCGLKVLRILKRLGFCVCLYMVCLSMVIVLDV